MLRIVTANLNGIRSATQKGFLNWIKTHPADIICLQELKAQSEDLTQQMKAFEDYLGYFHFAEKKGYSGVGIYCRQKPDNLIEGIGHAEIDSEGRYLRADFGKLSVISLYLPSGSSSPERQEAKFHFMAQFQSTLDALRKENREILICGDWNIAHREIDLKNWKGNLKNSGFLPEERAWLSNLFEQGWVDVYRFLHPEATEEAYTWWSNRGQARAKNVGWRIDYHIATAKLAAQAKAASIYKAERFSDHAPLIIDYDWQPE